SFVFDELHAYENRMFAAVVALIRALPGASFLLMTASLPKARKDFLLKEVGRVQEVPAPKDLEELPRYTFEQLPQPDEADQIVRQATAQKQKVLWVCNTVSRAQRTFERLRDMGLPVGTYHSRFKYEDRRRRHSEVVTAFSIDEHAEGLIAVTTQVAEMSLDLDADILISDIAPIASLIQRLGRLNRRIAPDKPGSPRTGYFIDIQPSAAAPYSMGDLELAKRWIEELKNLSRPLSQADLAESFNSMSSSEELHLDLRTEWLDSGWFAIPGLVREGGISVSVILPEDETVCRRDRKEIIWKAIPMNFDSRRGMDNWRELKGSLIAPPNTILYSKEIGARWLKQ
ncbi:MAG: CRISPR-associated helicase Cas3', partial [Acidobacteria bacterium]